MSRLVIAFLILIHFLGVNARAKTTVNIDEFLKLGCKRVDFNGSIFLDCSSAKLEEKYSCVKLREVASLFTGLSPQVPIIECVIVGDSPILYDGKAVFSRGCGMQILDSKYIVYSSQGVVEIKNSAEFVSFFGPVETKAEAMAFAVGLTGYTPKFDSTVPNGFTMMVDKIIPSYVEKLENGYKIRLFGYQCEGCEQHPYFFVDIRVDRNGTIEELMRQNVYRNPAEDNVCID